MKTGDYERYRSALRGEPLPAAIVDLDAFDANLAAMLEPVRAAGKALRIATKSVRCPALIRRALEGGARGLMTYSAAETAFLAGQGFSDLLLAYPTMFPGEAVRAGAAVVIDCDQHAAALPDGAPVVIDVDVSYRVAGLHLGVRRSPLREPEEVVALARRIAGRLEFRGLLAYEAQIAGLADVGSARLLKRLSRPDVARRRARLDAALREAGLKPKIFNGGGSGSLASSCAEAVLTEVTAGSALLAGHLFDRMPSPSGRAGASGFRPALRFALEASRRPARGLVTCLGGGIIASGAPGRDRLPLPMAPLRLLPLEGAGEVQTPLEGAAGVELGAPVFFRPAKSGEPAERFNEYLLVRGDRVVERAPTYRGLGRAFLT